MIEPSSAFSSRSDEVVAGILGKAGTLRAGVSKGPPASTEVAVLDARIGLVTYAGTRERGAKS